MQEFKLPRKYFSFVDDIRIESSSQNVGIDITQCPSVIVSHILSKLDTPNS